MAMMRLGTFNGTRRVHLYRFIFMPCEALLRSVISPPTMISDHIANRSTAAGQQLEHLLSAKKGTAKSTKFKSARADLRALRHPS